MKRERSPHIVAARLALDIDAETARILDGQSKIANWLWNELLDESNQARSRLIYLNPKLDTEETSKKEGEAVVPATLSVLPPPPPCTFVPILPGQSEIEALVWFLYGRRTLRGRMVQLKVPKPFLCAVYSSVSKNVALRLSRAIRDTRLGARKKRLAWPHYNRWSSEWFSLEYDEPSKGYRIEQGKIILQLGVNEEGKRITLTLPLKEPRPSYVKPSNVRALRIVRKHGVYYAVLTVTRDIVEPKPLASTPRVIALDPGHINPVVGFDDNGAVTIVSRPTFLASLDKRIDTVRSKRDHCFRKSVLKTSAGGKSHWQPSRRWRLYDKVLSKLLRQRQEQIKTWSYQLSNAFYRDNDVVSMGNYAPHGGGRSKGERRSVNNRSLVGTLRSTLGWVAIRSGKQFVTWNERGSTRTCFDCGHKIDGGIPTSIREWDCPVCGTHNHRDGNAARHGLVRTLTTLSQEHGISNLPSSGHHAITAWRTWRLTEAGITQVVSTPESVVA